jgi:hypothetical protein
MFAVAHNVLNTNNKGKSLIINYKPLKKETRKMSKKVMHYQTKLQKTN